MSDCIRIVCFIAFMYYGLLMKYIILLLPLLTGCDYARAKFHQLEAYKIAYEVDKEVKAMWKEMEAVKWE